MPSRPAGKARRRDEVGVDKGERRSANRAGEERHVDDDDRDHRVEKGRAERGDDRERQKQVGERHQHVDAAHQKHVGCQRP